MITRRKLISAAAIACLAPAFSRAQGLTGAFMATAPAIDYSGNSTINDVKTVVVTALGFIPEVGGLVAAFVGLLWPTSSVDIWASIKAEVESLINEKIDDAVYSLIKSLLPGLGDTLKLYTQAVATQDTETIRMQFIASNTELTAAASQFRNPDYEWQIAPLFAIFSQIHVSLLRDCAVNGKNWGWSAATYDSYVTLATDTINDYATYLSTVMSNRKTVLTPNAPTSTGQHRTSVYSYWQPFDSSKTTLLDDFRVLLVYSDPVKYPGTVNAADIPFADVYSKVYGTADDWNGGCKYGVTGVEGVWTAPLANISSISIEMFNRAPRVVTVHYPAGTGPRNPLWSSTNRYDDPGIFDCGLGEPGVEKSSVSIKQPTDGKRFNIAAARVSGGSRVSALSLVYDDGTQTGNLWQAASGDPVEQVSVTGRKLTTLNMWSVSKFYDYDLGAILFGFSRDPFDIPPQMKDLFYVTALTGRDRRSRHLPATVSNALKARRDTFWRDISRQVPKPYSAVGGSVR